jgi:flagellar motor switch protein FliN/FliY
MSDDNVLDQNEIERLLGGLGGGASPPPPSPASTPAPAPNGVLNQSELDALFHSGGAGAAAPASSPAPASSSSGPLAQSELDSLFGSATMAPVPLAAPLGQAELDSLFGNAPPTPPLPPKPAPAAQKPAPAKPATPTFAPPPPPPPPPDDGSFGGFAEEDDEEGIPRGDIDYLMKRAEDSLRSVTSAPMDLPAEVIEFQFPEFGGTVPSTEHATLDQISEVELEVKIELGRTDMYLEDILKLRKGSVVPLDKMAGDAVDIFINGRLLARGEVLVMNENFCVRVAELLAGAIPME